MYDWTSDQYVIDDSSYPDFSDKQIVADTYEEKYQYEQQNYPAAMPCQCGRCAMSYLWPRERKMRRFEGMAAEGASEAGTGVANSSVFAPIADYINLNPTINMHLFLFLLILIFCLCVSRSASPQIIVLDYGQKNV